jgi:hypothetical protein
MAPPRQIEGVSGTNITLTLVITNNQFYFSNYNRYLYVGASVHIMSGVYVGERMIEVCIHLLGGVYRNNSKYNNITKIKIHKQSYKRKSTNI